MRLVRYQKAARRWVRECLLMHDTLQTFRLKEEDDYTRTRFDVKFSSRLVKKKRHTRKLHCLSFPLETLAWFFILREVKHLTTCFRQNDIFAKTRRKMTTFIMFSRQNEAGSRASALLIIEKSPPARGGTLRMSG